MTQLFIRLFLISLAGLYPVISQAVELVVNHQLTVQINPELHQLTVEDKIELPATGPREIFFSLHRNLQPESLIKSVTLSPIAGADSQLFKKYKLLLPVNINSFSLRYQGQIHHPLEAYGKEQSRGYRQSPGLISPEGVFLAGSSHWFPQIENYSYLKFNMTVELPAGWSSVSQGERVEQGTHNGITIDNWDSQSPQEEIYLIAAQFTEYNQQAGNINAQVFLRQPDEKLANQYLEATAKYVGLFEKLLGPYPYAKFALVENFWETGFGMPSFTLLGSKVIRLPFILNSSYPHEILHNWWGNGVYVDFDTGNWSEGLTAYLADHLIKQQQGKAADYRLHSLQKYSDYAAKDRDFALNQFRGRHSSASEAVGYGKTLMLFHMLRQQTGDELFRKALQQFYQHYQFKIASYHDLQKTFETVTGKNLEQFFSQWVKRTGAAQLTLDNSKVTRQQDTYKLSFELVQTQSGEPYNSQVPVAVTLQGQTKAFQSILSMSAKQQSFELVFNSRPLRIDIDPEFDLFRKLDLAETPAAFTQLFGAKTMLVLLPRASNPELKTAWLTFANSMKNMGPDKVEIKWDDEIKFLPVNQAVTILGWQNRFVPQISSALSGHGVDLKPDSLMINNKQIQLQDHSIALTTRSNKKEDIPVAFIATDTAEALTGLARKLPHYHKYSYLAFEGNEPQIKLKGRWSVNQSPLTYLFDKNVKRAELAERPALIEADSLFNSANMEQTIHLLTSKQMQGRGFAQSGLDKSADYISRKFQESGLQPAGDHQHSYFQSWQDKGGDPEQNTLLKNVIGVIPGTHPTLKQQNIVIGAHYDHLGFGWPDVRAGNSGLMHPGADDNASGVAVLLELARVLGKNFKPDRSIVFVAFTGEEAGRKGSRYYIEHAEKYPANKTFAMINLDTVGRLGNNIVLVLGASSADEWPHIFRGVGYVSGIPIVMVNEELDSSDQVSFHQAGIPAVQLFSGVNHDYHRPTDSAEKIDYAGLQKIATITKQVIEYLSERQEPLSSNLLKASGNTTKSTKQRKVSLGSIPDFTFQGDGYRLDGVSPDSPAERAGLTKGDIIIKINDAEIHGLRDISTQLKTMQAGQVISITYKRQGKQEITRATLQSK